MNYIFSSSELIFAFVGALCIYLLIVGIVYGKKLISTWGKLMGQPVLQTATTVRQPGRALASREELPPLIDKPADHPSEQAGLYPEETDEPRFEMVEDDGFTTLLKGAERVVEQIQDVVNNIASSPANPDEVFTKVRAIVSKYGIFKETEYYDAINSFVAVTVQRDCDLTLTEEDLTSLWEAQAA